MPDKRVSKKPPGGRVEGSNDTSQLDCIISDINLPRCSYQSEVTFKNPTTIEGAATCIAKVLKNFAVQEGLIDRDTNFTITPRRIALRGLKTDVIKEGRAELNILLPGQTNNGTEFKVEATDFGLLYKHNMLREFRCYLYDEIH